MNWILFTIITSKYYFQLKDKLEVHLGVLLWIRKDELPAISVEGNSSIQEKSNRNIWKFKYSSS